MSSAVMYGARSGSGNQPKQRRLPEAASKTFLMGVPVQLSAGYLQEWDGTTLTAAIVGISAEPARNRTSAGVPQVFNTPPAPPNQTTAVVIQLPPFDDGRLSLCQTNEDTYFFGQVGSSQTVTQANVGIAYGMTKDSDNHWYVDLTKTTTSGSSSSNQAVVTIVGLDDWDPRGVFFQFLSAAEQQA